MNARTLAILERLERRGLDLLARELAAAGERVAAAGQALAAHRAARPGEAATGWRMDGGGQVVAAFWLGSRERESALAGDLAHRAIERDRLESAVVEARAALRRYEIVYEHLTLQQLRDGQAREAAQIDERASLQVRPRRIP